MKGLFIFIKNPILGKVKTRLAATVGDENALIIYQKLLLRTKKVALDTFNIKKVIFYSDFVIENDIFENGNNFEKKVQSGTDLGVRMYNAFCEGINNMGMEKVVLIGSDCPGLSSEILVAAFEALDAHDAVIGPAADGGYYLIGLKKLIATIFQDMEWSTDEVLKTTLSRLAFEGHSVAQLPVLSDIDTETDWIPWQKKL